MQPTLPPTLRAWLLLTFGSQRQYSGNAGYADDPAHIYRYDSLVQNSRQVAAGDLVVLRDRTAMLGFATIEEITSRSATKLLRRCPVCSTTRILARRNRQPTFRCSLGHEFPTAREEQRPCKEFEAHFGDSFHAAPQALSIQQLRAACPRYADQLSIQALDVRLILAALQAAGLPSPQAPSDQGVPGSVELGSTYRPADEESRVADRDPFEVDPQVIERGTRGHAKTQNALAAFLHSVGLIPRSPSPGEPDYDLAWRMTGLTFVAEIKSLTTKNEERQLRLGLGQVLRYRHQIAGGAAQVAAVLAVERAPTDDSWPDLCRTLGVALVWPAIFQSLVAELTPESPEHSSKES